MSSDKHIVITGGLGFIGHHLVRYYIDRGFRVTLVDNLETHTSHAALTKYRIEYIDNKKVDFIQSNCSLSFSIKEKMKFTSSPRSLIHLASHPNQFAVEKDEYGAASSMIANTLATAKFATELGARYVYVSSSMVYGNFTSTLQPENSHLNPINLYGLLKAQGEEIAKLTHGNTVIVRPSAVYGPGDNINRVLGKWISAAFENTPIVVNDASSLLDFTYVSDLVAGIAAIEENGSSHQAYNITRGQARSLGEVALLIKQFTNSKTEIKYLADTDLRMPQRGALDISKATAHTGYNPKIDIIDGLQRYIQWMRNRDDLYRVL